MVNNKYLLVRRTKGGSLVTIKRDRSVALLEITNHKDMTDISNLLNATGVRWKMYQTPRLAGKGWIIEFNFSDLESVICAMRTSNHLLEVDI